MNKRVALHTLGCKLNFSETSTLGRLLEQDGFVRTDFNGEADVYVINTCSVTENADKECRQLVRRIQRRAPGATVVITGCYAQLKPQEIAEIPGVDLVLGAAEKFNLVQHLQDITKGDPAKICSCDIEDVNSFTSSYSLNDRTRVFLKVQDGCDYSCTFCTIPLARGKSRSDSIERVRQQVAEIGQQGVREVVIGGINLGDFGKGLHGGKKREESFFELIQALDEDGAVDRFRISSIEPNLLSDEIIDFVASSKHFMPHFHIPLQSGSNRILALMRRRYQRELYAARVERIKSRLPHACIGVDVITGFPGEDDAAFEETFHFLHTIDISYLHVFTYSERANTPAIDMDGVVPISVRQERTKRLRTLSYQKMQYFTAAHIGQTRPVLFEHGSSDNKVMEGFTDNYIKVTIPYQADFANQIVDWMI